MRSLACAQGAGRCATETHLQCGVRSRRPGALPQSWQPLIAAPLFKDTRPALVSEHHAGHFQVCRSAHGRQAHGRAPQHRRPRGQGEWYSLMGRGSGQWPSGAMARGRSMKRLLHGARAHLLGWRLGRGVIDADWSFVARSSVEEASLGICGQQPAGTGQRAWRSAACSACDRRWRGDCWGNSGR